MIKRMAVGMAVCVIVGWGAVCALGADTPALDWAVDNVPSDAEAEQYAENQAAAAANTVVDASTPDYSSSSDTAVTVAVVVVIVAAIAGGTYWYLHKKNAKPQTAELETDPATLIGFNPTPNSAFELGLLPLQDEALAQGDVDLKDVGGALSFRVAF